MNTTLPLVSVICLCYNHERFLRESISSVLHQTYPNIQIIVVDDASTDNSVVEIKKILNHHPAIEHLLLEANQGNCKAFNKALALAKGKYVIDLSTDDVLTAERIERQVQYFETLSEEYGVVFTDADYIKSNGDFVYHYYQYLFDKRLLRRVPEGDIYKDVIARYFIAPPTMMMRRSVLVELNGYDENLAYEDFDFWIRSSRMYKYALLNERLTKIRLTENSLSTRYYSAGDKQLHSTYLVCKKIKGLNRTKEENDALAQRLRYEIRQSVFTGNKQEAILFYELLKEIQPLSFMDRLLVKSGIIHLPLRRLLNIYHQWRYSY